MQEGEGGGVGCIPQLCTDSKKKKGCVVKILTVDGVQPLRSAPPPSVFSPASREGGVSSCVLVFVLFVW